MKYIFRITLKAGRTTDEYVAAWEAGSAIIQRLPGAMGTRLHRAIGQPGVLLAIATWESKASRDAAMEHMRKSDLDTQAVWQAPRKIGTSLIIGEYEEPEWQILPPK